MTDTLLSTVVAGVNASIVESILTYPLEYIKTRQQLIRQPRGSKIHVELPELGRAYFKGCSPVIAGNATRAFARFSIYNWATKFMADKQGAVSAPQVVVAGMLTGICESFIVVPFESIKTTMIERAIVPVVPVVQPTHNLPKSTKPGQPNLKVAVRPPPSQITKPGALKTKSPQHVRPPTPEGSAITGKPPVSIRPPAVVRPSASGAGTVQITSLDGFAANVRAMYRNRGLRSFVQGFWPTLTRQATSSAVKFSTYHFLKQFFHPNDTEPIHTWLILTLGCLTGAIQVIATQPIDMVKTRMQSINGVKTYGNSLNCGYRIFADEGALKLWTGIAPRFIKVTFSGGIVFMVYEASNSLVTRAMKENPFASS